MVRPEPCMTSRLLYPLLSVAVFLATAEIAARTALSQRAFLDRIDQTGEAGRRLSGIAAMSIHGKPALYGMGAITHDPIRGWKNGEFSGEMGVDHYQLTTDRAGRRITAPPAWSAPDDAPTVLLVGDSFVFGDEVSDADTWAWKVREALDVPVHNHGTIGFGFDQTMLLWEELADERPDVVVVGINTLMAYRVLRTFDTWAKPRFELHDGTLNLTATPVPTPQELRLRWWTPHAWELAKVWWHIVQKRRHGDPPLAPVNDALAERLSRTVHGMGAKLVFVFLPLNPEYQRPEMWEPAPVPTWTLFQAWCEAGLADACVDLKQPFMDAHAAGRDLQGQTHWSPDGHTVVAEAVSPVLRGLLDLPTAQDGQAEDAEPPR